MEEVVADMEAVNDESGIDEDEEYHSAVELTEDVMLQESPRLYCFIS